MGANRSRRQRPIFPLLSTTACTSSENPNSPCLAWTIYCERCSRSAPQRAPSPAGRPASHLAKPDRRTPDICHDLRFRLEITQTFKNMIQLSLCCSKFCSDSSRNWIYVSREVPGKKEGNSKRGRQWGGGRGSCEWRYARRWSMPTPRLRPSD